MLQGSQKENVTPSSEVDVGTAILRMEKFMTTHFQTLQAGQTETVSGLGILSSQMGGVIKRCDDMEKLAKAEKARLDEVIENMRLLNTKISSRSSSRAPSSGDGESDGERCFS